MTSSGLFSPFGAIFWTHGVVGPKGRVVFDYDEFTEEGYEAIDEEIDQSLFEFFVSDYEAEVSFLTGTGY